MSNRSPEEMERISSVLGGLYSQPRLAVLLGLRQGRTVPEIVDQVAITRPGLQKNIEAMIDAELVYRPSEEKRTYALTPLGRHLADVIDAEADLILAVLDHIDAREETVRDQLESVSDLPINQTEMERAIHTRKWELAKDDIEELLSE